MVRNPASGSADSEESAEAGRALRRLGSVDVLETSSREALPQEVRAAAGHADLVVVSGGDGSFGDVVNALADRIPEIVFAVLPAGTGNDLARTLGLPEDPLSCARSLDPASIRTLDLCRASAGGERRLFVNACLGGFPVDADEAIAEDDKRRLGSLAFWVGGAKAALDLQRATVRMNGVEVPDCVAVGVGNGRSAGGGIEVWPDADPSDGELDACALGAPGAVGAARVGMRVVRGTHGALDAVHTTRAAKITIEADSPVEFNVDGELVGLSTPAEFEVVGKLRVALCG